MSDIERKLATIERITFLAPIDGADKIEVATIRGWRVVVQKDLYKINDLVCFFEIDSFLPIRPEYEFLRKSSFRNHSELGEGFRIKTVKLRGQISQGMVMPLTEIIIISKEGYMDGRLDPYYQDYEEGTDLTKVLNIRKWEQPSSKLLAGNARGFFPSFIPKTDEPRLQNLRYADWAEYAQDTFVYTLKMDGSSMTIFNKGGDVLSGGEQGVCSRNLELKDDDSSAFWRMAKKTGCLPYLNNIAVQGELVGPGIQGNPHKLTEIDFYVFNIFNIEEQRYYNFDAMRKVIKYLNNCGTSLKMVDHNPIMRGISMRLEDEVEYFTKKMGYPVEGVVAKSIQHPYFSYKYINPEYLLKDKD